MLISTHEYLRVETCEAVTVEAGIVEVTVEAGIVDVTVEACSVAVVVTVKEN